MKRRQFLETTLASLTAAPLLASQEFSTDPVAQVQLTPEVSCTRIGFGTGVHGGGRQSNITRMDRAFAVDLVRYAYDCGIRFFDMADMYGSHSIVAEALEGKPRDSYVLSSKIWHQRGGIPEPERLSAEEIVPRFLKELKTDYLDVVQLHCMRNAEWVKEHEEQFEPMERLKKKGLIRAHGVSCHGHDAAQIAAVHPWVDVMHIRINPENKVMSATWDETLPVIKKAKENGKGVIMMKVLGEGRIDTPEARRASTFAVTQKSGGDVMIIGFEKRQHIDEFLTNVTDALKEMAH